MSDQHRPFLRTGTAARSAAGLLSAALVAALTVVVPTAPAAAALHWSDPVGVSVGETDASDVRAAASHDGTRVAAVWEKSTGLTTSDVRLARSSNGGAAWSTPITLGAGDQPQIVTSASGQRITVVWAQFIDGDNLARTRSSSDGGATWTAPRTISLADYRVDHLRMAASDDAETITVTWSDIQSGTSPGTQRVRVATSEDGGATWSAPHEVTDVSDYQGKNPAVTVSANGNVQTVVWMARGPSEFSVFAANTADGGTTWSAKPVRVTWTAGTPQGDTVVQSTADGKVVTAAWQTNVFSELSIVAATSVTSGETWRNWRLLGDGSGPSLAHNADGSKWAAVWTSSSAESAVEAALTTDAGDRWTERTVLAPPGGGTQATLASSPDGERLFAVWRNDNGRLWAAGSDDGGVHWDPSALAAETDDAHHPAAVASATRRQIAVWPGDDSISAATAHYKSQQVITFPALPDSVQFSAGPVQLRASVSSDRVPTYRSDTPNVCRISGNTAVPVSAGVCKVTALAGPSDDYEPAAGVQRSVTIQRSAQTITFPSMRTVALGAERVALRAVSSSKLAIVYRSEAPPVCTIQGSTAVLIATGQCVITATQPGSGGYLPAASVMKGFEVKRNGQSIQFGVIGNKLLTVGTIKLRAKADSGLRVDFTSLTQQTCRADGATLRLLKPGDCTVRAEQTGNAEYAPARAVTRSFTIVRQAPSKPDNAVFRLRGAKRTVVTWDASQRADRYVVRVNDVVRCQTPRNDRQCTLGIAFGPRSNVTVTAYNDGVPSQSATAKSQPAPRWFAMGPVDFARNSKSLGARARKVIEERAAMLDRNGFAKVLVTGQTGRSENRGLAAKRAKAVGAQLKRSLKRRDAKVKVTAQARAGRAPKVSRAVLWIR